MQRGYSLIVLLLAFVLAPVLVACEGNGELPPGTGEQQVCASSEVLCVGLVTDVGRIDDRGFNQSAWEGVVQARAVIGAQVSYIETVDSKDYAENIEYFLQQDYDIIVTVGFSLGDSTRQIALEYPDTSFIGVDQYQATVIPNVAGLIFDESKAGFLAGALAAQLSQSGTIATVLGTELVPPVVAFKVGYENGAAYINPNVRLISTYHPGTLEQAFTDPDWGAATTRQAIGQGADVVFGAGGATGNGALIEAASTEGVYCIGVDTDQWATLPEAHSCLVSSAVKHITPGVYELIALEVAGQFPAGNYVGDVGLAPFHDFDGQISQEIRETLATIEAGLQDGSIQTGYIPAGLETE